MPDQLRIRRPGPVGLSDLQQRAKRPLAKAKEAALNSPRFPFGVGDDRVLFAGPPVNVDKLKKYKEKADKIKDYYERAQKLIDPETRPRAVFDELFNAAIDKLTQLFGKGIKKHPFFKYHETHFKVLRKLLDDVGTLDAAEKAFEAAEETVVRMNKESYDIHQEGQKIAKGRKYDRLKKIQLSIYNQVRRKSYEVLGTEIGYDGEVKRILWRDYLLQLKWEIMDDRISAEDLQAEIDCLKSVIIPAFLEHIREDRQEAVDITLDLTARFALLSAYLMTVDRYLDEYQKKLKKLEKSSEIGAIMADNKRKQEQTRFRELEPGVKRVRRNAENSLISGRREVRRWIAFTASCYNGDALLYDPTGALQWPWEILREYPLDD